MKAFLFTILNPKICVSIVVKSVNILKTFFKFSKVWMSWKHFCEKHLCPKRARNCLLALGKVGKGAQTSNRGTGIGGIRFETDWFGYFSRLSKNVSFKYFLNISRIFLWQIGNPKSLSWLLKCSLVRISRSFLKKYLNRLQCCDIKCFFFFEPLDILCGFTVLWYHKWPIWPRVCVGVWSTSKEWHDSKLQTTTTNRRHNFNCKKARATFDNDKITPSKN